MKRMGTSIAIIMVAMLLVVSCENPSSSAGDEPGTEITTTDTADIEGAFITVWKTTAANELIMIPINSEYTYNYDVDWGDGTIDSNLTTSEIHEYSNAGLHKVQITGTFPTIYFYPNNCSLINDEENKDRLVTIKQWGDICWKTMSFAFDGCANVTLTATDTPDLSEVSDMHGMFYKASAFNGDLSKWDVSNVSDMGSMFSEASAFNGDLSNWDVSNVSEIRGMFSEATAFNGDLSNWKLSKVTDMECLFLGATAFNGDLSSWNVSRVTNMECLFASASVFNGDLSEWEVSKVTDMEAMFSYASAFNGDLSGWDVSNVTTMKEMFWEASAFRNHNLNGWNVSNVTEHTDFLTDAGEGNTEPAWK